MRRLVGFVGMGLVALALCGCDGLDGGPCPTELGEMPVRWPPGLRVMVADFDAPEGADIAEAFADALEARQPDGPEGRSSDMQVNRLRCAPRDHADALRVARAWRGTVVVWGGPCAADAGSICPRATVHREQPRGSPARAVLDLPRFPASADAEALTDSAPVAFLDGFRSYEDHSVTPALAIWLPRAPLDGPVEHGSWVTHRYLCQALLEVKGRQAEAAAHCQAALTHLPAEHDVPAGYVHNLLGSVLRDHVSTELAVGHMYAATRIARDDPDIEPQTVTVRMVHLSRALIRAERAEDAVAVIEAAMEEALARPEINGREILWLHEESGDILLEAGDPEGALDHYDEAMKALPYTSQRSTDDILRQMAKAHEALEAYADAVDALDRALVFARRAAAGRPGWGDKTVMLLLWRKGRALYKDDRAVEAEAAFDEALALKRADREPDLPSIAFTLEWLGRAQRAQARFDDALATLDRARETWVEAEGPDSPRLAETDTLIGSTLAKAGRLDAAEARLEQARRVMARAHGRFSEEAALLDLNLTVLACHRGRDACAAAAPRIREALAARLALPDGAIAPDQHHFALALCLMADRRYPEAVEQLERTLAGDGPMADGLPAIGASALLALAIAEQSRPAAGDAGVVAVWFTQFSPAPADVRRGDIITHYGGQRVTTVEELVARIEQTPRPTRLVRVRDGRRQTVPVVGEAPIGLFRGLVPEPFWVWSGLLAEQ